MVLAGTLVKQRYFNRTKDRLILHRIKKTGNCSRFPILIPRCSRKREQNCRNGTNQQYHVLDSLYAAAANRPEYQPELSDGVNKWSRASAMRKAVGKDRTVKKDGPETAEHGRHGRPDTACPCQLVENQKSEAVPHSYT